MADSPINPTPAAPVLPTLSPSAPRHWRLWPLVVGGLAVLGIVVGLSWWALAGNKFWTDGAKLHVNDNDARIREVVWTPPIPLTVFNTNDQEYEPSISPDGDELYFVRGKAGQVGGPGHNADIYVSYRRMGAWMPPVPVDAVNSEYDDLGPRVTADSKFLLFYSNRPGGFGGYDIWAAPRLPSDGAKPGGWGKPFNLGPGVNSEFDEYNPDPSPDGQRLFFATNRKAAGREQKQAWRATIRAGTNADFDLWYAVRVEGTAVNVTSLSDSPTTAPTTNPTTQAGVDALAATEPSNGTQNANSQAEQPALVYRNAIEVPGINTPYAEGASCMSPAGDFLYFSSDRPGGYGKFDIYRSRVGPDGTFGPVENLGPAINTSDNETDPQLALNGFRLYFSSDRHVTDSATAFATTMPSAGPAQTPAAEDGRYSLLQSDSREVYSVRAGHRLPPLSWSWLVLALSLLALVPLVMFMRKWDDQRLSLLQKCLLVSLLVHVLITLGLSMKKVTTDVIHYVRQEQGLEPPVDLTLTLNGPPGRGDDVGAAVRQQTSSDIPTASAPPAAAAQQRPDADALEAPSLPAGVQPVPQAGVGSADVMIPVQAPKVETPKLNPAAEAPQVVPSVTPQPPALDLKVAAVPHVSQAEPTPQVARAAAPVARMDQIGIEPKLDVPQVNAGEKSAPAAVQAGSMVESTVAARAALPTVNVAGPRAAAPPTDASVAIDAPRPVAAPVVSHAPETPAVAEASNASARQAAAPAVATAAKPAFVQPAVPAAEAVANSLASGVAPHAEPAPAELAAGAGSANRMVQPDAGSVAQVSNLTAPRSAVGKVSGAEAAVAAKAVPGVAKQGTASAPGEHPAAIAAILPSASTKVPTAQAAAESLTAGAAPHASPAATALATSTPAPVGPTLPADAALTVHPAVPLPGAAGPVASNHPDSPEAAEMLAGASRAGEAAGPGGPAILPRVAVPASAAPAVSGSAQSLASAPAPAAPASAGSTASSSQVQPAAAANVAAGPAVAAAPTASGSKVVPSAQPDAPTATEVASAQARHGSPGATTQPALADANVTGIAGANIPTVSGSAQSLATAPDAGSAINNVVGTPAQAVTPVTTGAVPSPVANVELANQSTVAVPRTTDAQPAAAEASPLPASPTTRTDTTAGATALADAGPVGLSLPAQPARTENSPAGVALAVAPTTRPLDTSTAVALARGSEATVQHLAGFAASPEVGSPRSGARPLAGLVEAPVAARAGDVNAGPTKVDATPLTGASGAPAAVDSAAPPAVAAGAPGQPNSADQSLASAATVPPREVVAGTSGRPAGATMATPAVAVAGPKIMLPKVVAAPAAGPAAGVPANATGTTEGGSIAVHRTQPAPGSDDRRPIPGVMLASAGVPGISAVPLSAGADPASKSLDSAASKTLPRTISGPPVAAPDVTVAVPKLAAPESLFQRSPEQRKPLVEKRGGTPESEGAVERALAYLARQQEPDGRWTVFYDDGPPGRRGQHPHDMACTGLATLAFLTADHTPAKEGPYRQTVMRSVDFLIGLESPDGDLRGPRQFRGGGADQGNMYDQGICTMALCEAALMTGDRRYTDAALRAARFILKAQNSEGGWRYTPAEAGDTSVLGWQLLALHDAEQLGFQVPEQSKLRAAKYLRRTSQGNTRILASYMPGEGATSAMTAEALFSRLLLGEEITGPQTQEVCDFLTRDMPNPGGADFYFWYYASLSLSQMPDLIKLGPQAGGPEETIAADAWKKWNGRTRDTLIKMQRKEGPGDGSWSDTRWGERGGRVFSTSLACLTLEVYYRYLPLRAAGDNDTNDTAPENDPRRAAAEIKASKPAGNGRAPVKPRGRGWDDNGGHYPGVEPN